MTEPEVMNTPIRDKIKPNILILTVVGALLAALFVAGGVSMVVMSGNSPSDMMVAAIAVMFTGAVGIGGAIIALAGQVATNDPPNHVQAVLDYGKYIIDRVAPVTGSGRPAGSESGDMDVPDIRNG